MINMWIEKIGLVTVKENASRVLKLEDKKNKEYKEMRDGKNREISLLIRANTSLKSKLYKANKWQLHLQLNHNDLVHTNLSNLIETKLKAKLKSPFTFLTIEEITTVNQSGKFKVFVNNDRDDTEFLYFSYIIQ